jgi:hypothetical protein
MPVSQDRLAAASAPRGGSRPSVPPAPGSTGNAVQAYVGRPRGARPVTEACSSQAFRLWQLGLACENRLFAQVKTTTVELVPRHSDYFDKITFMIAIRTFRYLYTRALSFLTITCKMESQKHASRFDLRYDTYSGLWCHKPMKELGFECDFVKVETRAPTSVVIELRTRTPTIMEAHVRSRSRFPGPERAGGPNLDQRKASHSQRAPAKRSQRRQKQSGRSRARPA